MMTSRLQLRPNSRGPDSRGHRHGVGAPVSHAAAAASGDELGLSDAFAHSGSRCEAAGSRVNLVICDTS